MKKKIKLFDPNTNFQEEQAIIKVLRSHNWASGEGSKYVTQFEKEFKKYVNSAECVTVNSGTAALHLALSLFSIKNQEVILPSLSFVSTAHSVVYNGGIPVFVDIDPQTLCIDPEMIKKSITKKTKAILPVHFAGMACNLKEIISVCKDFNISLIEDAAHAAGTLYNNKKIGSYGDAVCFSFHPVKNLAMPTGGAITLNGKESFKNKIILESLRWCGISNRRDSKYDVKRLGWNYYMNEFAAAMGLEQLKKLDLINQKRKKIAKRYFQEIQTEKKMPYNKEYSYHFYWLLVKNRNTFMKKMKSENIETGIHYFPIHKMSFYEKKQKLINTERVSQEIVSLPIHSNLSNSDVTRIIKLANSYI